MMLWAWVKSTVGSISVRAVKLVLLNISIDYSHGLGYIVYMLYPSLATLKACAAGKLLC